LRLAAASLKKERSNDLDVQLVRSLIVSCIALAVDFGSLLFFKEILGIHYLVAAAMSFSLGVVISYILSTKWVFATRKLSNHKAEFVVFLVICTVGLLLNLAIIAGMVQLLSIDYRVAKAISTVVVFFWNFIARKKILY
jgi:putative flippase GtrA